MDCNWVKVQNVEKKLIIAQQFFKEKLKSFTGLVGVLLVREGTSWSLNDFCRSPDSALHAFGQRLLLGKLGQESSDESVPGAVRVDDLKQVQQLKVMLKIKWDKEICFLMRLLLHDRQFFRPHSSYNQCGVVGVQYNIFVVKALLILYFLK
jgi:hypothetical protein